MNSSRGHSMDVLVNISRVEFRLKMSTEFSNLSLKKTAERGKIPANFLYKRKQWHLQFARALTGVNGSN